ncbi:MAG: hypothetical protein EXX96DRAFT_463846, partial [Benjaminiella poitrasii]
VVPTNLPFFQWTGNVYDSKQPVFDDMDSCFLRFEDTPRCYELDFDSNWLRL